MTVDPLTLLACVPAALALGGLIVNGAVGVFAGGPGRVSATIFTARAARLALMQRS